MKRNLSFYLVVLFLCFPLANYTSATVVQFESKYFVIPNNDQNAIDNDQDGYTEYQGDCNDSDSTISPGAIEVCEDNIDQDCNGSDLICPPPTEENRLLELINEERNTAGLPTLIRDTGLDKIISWHVNNMATDHFLSHSDKNGRNGEGRARYYSGDNSVRCSEIIQWWSGAPSGDAHYNGYFNSPAHHSAYMEEGIYNLGPTTNGGVAIISGTGPIGSHYEGKAGSYPAVFLCDKPLTIVIDPYLGN